MKVLLFDLDGTLVDSIELILASFRHAFASVLGEAPADEAWIRGIGTPLVSQIRGIVGDDDALVHRIMATYREYQLANHDRLLRGFDGVRETLVGLRSKGHPMGLVTSKMNDLAHRALAFTGLDGLMDVVVGFDSSARHKPDPEPVLIALEQLGRAPADSLFVGDSPHDIVAGNAAGSISVAALWGPFSRTELEAAKPRYSIASIRELPGLVGRLEAE